MKWGLSGAFAGTLFLIAQPAGAQLRLQDAEPMLESASADEVALALDAMGEMGRQAIPPLVARIERGLPAALLPAAIHTLVRLEAQREGEILLRLARHRNTEVRVAALGALASLRVRGAGEVLSDALGDHEPSVRGAAALALGALGDTAHLDRLFAALDRNVLEAAQSIGQLADGDAIERLIGYLGRVSFDSLTPAFQELFARNDVPQRAKLRLVGQLAELGTPGVRTYLMELADFVSDEEVQQAALSGADRIAQ